MKCRVVRGLRLKKKKFSVTLRNDKEIKELFKAATGLCCFTVFECCCGAEVLGE